MSDFASPAGWPDPSSRPPAGQPQDPFAPPAGEVAPPAPAHAGGYPAHAGGYVVPGGPPGYGPGPVPGAPPGGPPAYGYLPPKTNSLAVASMVVSIACALIMCFSYGFGGIAGAVGAVLGHLSRRQIRDRGEAGDGMAIAGIVVGWITFGLGALVVTVVVLFIWAVVSI